MPWKVVAKDVDGDWIEIVVTDRKVAIDLMNDMCDSRLYVMAGVYQANECQITVGDDDTLALTKRGRR